MIKTISLLLLLAWSYQVTAQTCCSGGVPVSNNIGFQSSDKGTMHLSISADFNFLKTLKNESETLDDDLRLRTTQSYILRSAITLSERFTVETFLPLVRQTRRITTNLGGFDRQSTFGLGDPLLLGIFDLVQKDITIRIGGGPQIPLGSFSEKDDRGLTLLEDLQPGSGAWDLILFSSVEIPSKKRPSRLFYLNAIYSMTGENEGSRNNTQVYEFGNDLQLITGISDQIFLFGQVLSPGLSLRYRYASRDLVDQSELPGTGGDFVFARLSNSVPFPIAKSNFHFNIEFPIWAKVNDVQLAPSYIINLGWSMLFEKNKESINLIDQY